MALAKTIKKTAVVSGVCDGFIGNRMIAAYSQQAMNLMEEGASPYAIDKALESFGMAMGPFRMSDLAGNDIGWAIRKHKLEAEPDPHYPRIADRLCELGRFGQKTGAGWYVYAADRRGGEADPIVNELIEAYRREKGIHARTVTDQEIVDRCILALVNEGARILDERIAQRASDIDVVYLSGYGFPAFRGGPMFYADRLGLKNVVDTMQRLQQQTGDSFWRPAPLLADRAAEGRAFNA
jgi:3-hydroxyacyl-CoA dehydrogenase